MLIKELNYLEFDCILQRRFQYIHGYNCTLVCDLQLGKLHSVRTRQYRDLHIFFEHTPLVHHNQY